MDDNRHAQGHEGDVVTPEGEGLRVRVSPDVQTREDATAAPRPVLFAIGDIHGNYDALQSILQTLQSRHQIFTDLGMETLADHVTLVFTGDYVDRGRHALKVLGQLASIKAMSGDRSVLLMGNHEAMSLSALGAMQYLADENPDIPARVFLASVTHAVNGGESLKEEIARRLPPDQQNNEVAIAKAYLEELGRAGPAGSLMRRLELLHFHKIARCTILFCHGDVPGGHGTWPGLRSREALMRVAEDFRTHVNMGTAWPGPAYKYGEELPGLGLLWSRDYTRRDFVGITPEQEDVRAQEICDACGVDYIVAGHTTTGNRRIKKFGGRILHIDVGMKPPTALMVSDAGISSVTADADKLLVSF